jgi:hypothetical protein
VPNQPLQDGQNELFQDDCKAIAEQTLERCDELQPFTMDKRRDTREERSPSIWCLRENVPWPCDTLVTKNHFDDEMLKIL